MRLRNDDQLHSIEDTFLGPPGWSLPFRVRYRSYGVGFVIFIAILALEREAGIGFGFGSIAWCLLLTVAITTGIMQVVTHERPLRALVVTFWQELNGPRPPGMIRYRLDARRVRIEPWPRCRGGGLQRFLYAHFRRPSAGGERRPRGDARRHLVPEVQAFLYAQGAAELVYRDPREDEDQAGPVVDRLEGL